MIHIPFLFLLPKRKRERDAVVHNDERECDEKLQKILTIVL